MFRRILSPVGADSTMVLAILSLFPRGSSAFVLGSGSSSAVERMRSDPKVVDYNPIGCWSFFSSLSFSIYISQQYVFELVTQGGATLVIRLLKRYLAVKLSAYNRQ